MPAITAINARLLDDYIADCEAVVAAWNRVIRDRGIDFQLVLPHRAFNRRQGMFKEHWISPTGALLDEASWSAQRDTFLPSSGDLEYVLSLMQPHATAGDFAPWISPPKSGVGGKPGDFEYVRLAS